MSFKTNYYKMKKLLAMRKYYYVTLKKLKAEPEHLVMELSSFCNLKCGFCYFHGFDCKNKFANQGRRNFATWDLVHEIVHQVKANKNIKRISSFHSGEELLHPEWYEMIKYILEETQIPYFDISTNGMLLNEENINKLRKLSELYVGKITLHISLAGNDSEECEFFREGVKYKTLKTNIQNAQRVLKDKLSVVINVDYMIDKSYFEKIGCKYEEIKFSTPDYIVNDFPEMRSIAGPTFLFGSPDEIPEKFQNICEAVAVSNKFGKCENLFKVICVDSEGYVLNCSCNGGFYRLGNVLDKNMFEIWKDNEMMKKARNKLRKQHVSPDFCAECPYQVGGVRNFWILVKK